LKKKISIELAGRVKDLPPYLFAAIDRMKQEAVSRGIDLIDLSVGDPDIPTPEHIVQRMKKAVDKPEHHRYPSYEGMLSYRQAVADWYKKRFKVVLNSETEVLSLIGSKEGIGHIPLAFINPGDVALVSSPGYPVYPVATLFAGGKYHVMPLVKRNNFLPDLKAVPAGILKKTKLLFVNYPNNPTTAIADRNFFKELIRFAAKNNIIVCHDAAYSEIYFDGQKPLSFLQMPGAKDVGIEFHSLSKTYNMTGWRIGFAVGNSSLIEALGAVKSNIDSGLFQAIQIAGITALNLDRSWIEKNIEIYKRRRDIMVDALNRIGLSVEPPKATFYLWIKVPKGYTSAQFATRLLEEAGIVVIPGNGFGEPGEGYIRISLTQKDERLKEAVSRIEKIRL